MLQKQKTTGYFFKNIRLQHALHYDRSLWLEPLEDRFMLAAFTVTNLLDGVVTAAGDLPGSLRQALFDSKALAGADTIDFSTGPGTISLSAGQLEISDDVTINGLGANQLTIDAGGNSRVLLVSSGMVAINGLTFSGGYSDYGLGLAGRGGGVYNSADLTISNCTIIGNSATNGGGIYNSLGTLTINNSRISGNSANSNNGGGIISFSTLNVNNSTISGNTSKRFGGGIYKGGNSILNITNSTISGNLANNWGGGICDFRGDIEFSEGSDSLITLNVTNSTISGNSAGRGGGIYNGLDTWNISNSTIVGNSAKFGGGIFSKGSVTLSHALISGNTAPNGSEIYAFNTVNLNNYNLLGDNSKNTAAALSGVSVGATDITATIDGSHTHHINSIIHPALADNGGPTLTHSLTLFSPAIDGGDTSLVAGVGTTPLYDQRGIGLDRVVDIGAGAVIDIGAYEVQTLPQMGDLNLDGFVDAADFTIVASNFGPSGGGYADGNLNSDAFIDAADISILFNNWTGDAGPMENFVSYTNTIQFDRTTDTLSEINPLSVNTIMGLKQTTEAAIDEQYHQEELLRTDADQQSVKKKLCISIAENRNAPQQVASHNANPAEHSALDEALLALSDEQVLLGNL